MTTCGGIILCGGKSTRMGRSKAWLPIGDEVLLQRVARLLGSVVQPLVVVAAAEQALPELPPGVIVATDQRPERGPLEGLRAGLRALPEDIEAAYVSSCDAPLLRPQFVRFLCAALREADAAVPYDDQGERPLHHPLAAVYRRRVLPALEKLLASEQLRLVYLLDAVNTRRIPLAELRSVDPQLDSLVNVNHRAEYEAALQRLRAHG